VDAPGLHPQHARIPGARGIDVVGRNEDVLDVRKGMQLIYIEEETMYVADLKRLTAVGAKKIMPTAPTRAGEAGIAVTIADHDRSRVHRRHRRRRGSFELDERVAREAADAIK
jgi:hypothetical protein